MDLYQLTKAILTIQQKPIGRIRLAKTIYLVHKDLVRQGMMQLQDIAYLRLPLGPAPDGLPAMILDHPDIIAQHNTETGFFHELTEYTVEPGSTLQPSAFQAAIQKSLNALQTKTTLELVEASHDPSWRTHYNGERYYLTPADLKTVPILPNLRQFRFKIHFKPPKNANELSSIQAKLIRGMLPDIIKESTDLEYPDPDKPTNTKNATKPRHQAPKSSQKGTREHR